LTNDELFDILHSNHFAIGHYGVPRQPWEVLSIDLMGSYPRTQRGKTKILVVTDCYSRWVEAYPLGKATTKSILPELISRLKKQEIPLADSISISEEK